MAAHQASASLGFSRQEHWSGLPFPSPMHESEKWKWSRSVVSDSSDPMDCSPLASPSTGFSRQEYWSGVPLPSPQLLSYVQLFATTWTAACQAFLSFTISQSLLKLMSIEAVTPSNHLNLCHLLLLLSSSFPTKVYIVQALVFPVVTFGDDIWTIKKAERWRIDAFEMWCWRRLWRVPWIARRFNQSSLKEINPEYSLEGLMLKLKLQ